MIILTYKKSGKRRMLTVFPEKISDNVVEISCHDLRTETLPTLPVGLEVLICQKTQITILPELPESLKVLAIINCNQLLELPKLPAGLEKLIYKGNSDALKLPIDLPANIKLIVE